MRVVPRTSGALLAVALLPTVLAGCGRGTPKHAGPTAAPPTASLTAGPTGDRAALPVGDQPVDLNPADFTVDITHPYWPIRPGTRWTYRETDDEGAVVTTVVVATTQTRKVAAGITVRLVRDTVSEKGRITEDTMDYYAQDANGNLWYFGEDTAEFEDGKVTSKSGSFEAGADGAQPGIILPAQPAVGQKDRQEYYKGQAEDNGEVLSTVEMAQVPLGLYRDVVLTKDTNRLEPDKLEYKFYAKGVGPALILDIAGATGREQLIKVDHAPSTAGTGPLGKPNP